MQVDLLVRDLISGAPIQAQLNLFESGKISMSETTPTSQDNPYQAPSTQEKVTPQANVVEAFGAHKSAYAIARLGLQLKYYGMIALLVGLIITMAATYTYAFMYPFAQPIMWFYFTVVGLGILVALILFIGMCMCIGCLLYTSPSPRDATLSRMPSSA